MMSIIICLSWISLVTSKCLMINICYNLIIQSFHGCFIQFLTLPLHHFIHPSIQSFQSFIYQSILHFWAKIAPNRTILAKLHYYELFGQNLLFRTFGPKLHFFVLFGKNHTSLKQNCTFFQMPCLLHRANNMSVK